LNTLLSSNFCEILGHEIALKYLSRQGPKAELRDRPMLLLSGTSEGAVASPGYKVQPADSSLIVMQHVQLAEFDV